jgi:hypothetical protein
MFAKCNRYAAEEHGIDQGRPLQLIATVNSWTLQLSRRCVRLHSLHLSMFRPDALAWFEAIEKRLHSSIQGLVRNHGTITR